MQLTQRGLRSLRLAFQAGRALDRMNRLHGDRPAALQAFAPGRQWLELGATIEPLRGHLLPVFRDQGDLSGGCSGAMAFHLGCGGHFKVAAAAHRWSASSSRSLAGCGGGLALRGTVIHRLRPSSAAKRQSGLIGFLSPTGLAHIGDVIDYSRQAGHAGIND